MSSHPNSDSAGTEFALTASGPHADECRRARELEIILFRHRPHLLLRPRLDDALERPAGRGERIEDRSQGAPIGLDIRSRLAEAAPIHAEAVGLVVAAVAV